MSAGNGCAMIGLANTNKIPMIGGYKQVATTGSPLQDASAAGPFIGVNGGEFWNRNVLGEAVGFTVPTNTGAAAGKTAQWVTTSAGLAAGTTRVSIAAGVATADNAAGAYDVFNVPAAGVPANSYFWAFER